MYILPIEIMVSPDTLLRGGDYVLAAEEPVLKMLMHVDASKNGKEIMMRKYVSIKPNDSNYLSVFISFSQVDVTSIYLRTVFCILWWH